MFLPLHGTFFFNRGVDPGAFLTSGLVGVTGAFASVFPTSTGPTVPFGVDGRCSSVFVASGPSASPAGSTTSGTGFAMLFAVSVLDGRPTLLCLRVSVLDRALGCCLEDNRDDVGRPPGLARGVAELLPSNQAASSPEGEPLNEECSLSVPSLSQ